MSNLKTDSLLHAWNLSGGFCSCTLYTFKILNDGNTKQAVTVSLPFFKAA